MVTGVCTSGAQAMSLADNLGDGIVVSGYKLTDMLYIELNDNLPKGFELLLITSKTRWDECNGSGVICLAMPLKTGDIVNTVEMMLLNITRRKKKIKQQAKERSQEEKAIIQQAKELLMEKNNMTESEAHRYIQKNSMNSGTNMVDYAESVLKIMYSEPG